MFGAHIPNVDYTSGDKVEECIHQFMFWIGRYPQQISVYARGKFAKFSSVFLSKFVGFRKKIYEFKRDNYELEELDGEDEYIDVDEFNFDLEDLKQVYYIMNELEDASQIQNLDLYRCDQVVKNFGLDKERDLYFYWSRRMADSLKVPYELIEQSKQLKLTKDNNLKRILIEKDSIAVKSFTITLNAL